ncbi:MAG TPA: DUF1573 domain-containing protein [Oligoflexia bacterium]|nr:DUF1573 domain-containing protein [Oligoflexia bacterium]HMP27411.1 DUF1573 domain-containing protein [Oligoflexia bacterium]
MNWRPSFTIVLKTNLYWLFLLYLFFLSTASAEPKISFSSNEFNFGEIVEGDLVRHSFEVKNEGDSELILYRILTGCGCLHNSAINLPIPPKGSSNIEITFFSEGLTGNQDKLIKVFTNQPDSQSNSSTSWHYLYLRGKVKPLILAEPTKLFLGKLPRNSDQLKKEYNFKIKLNSKKAGLIKEIFTPSKFIVLKTTNILPMEAEFSISFVDKLPIGELRDRIVVLLEGGQTNSFNIPVYANFVGAVDFEPPVVSFGLIEDKNRPISKTIAVNYNSEDAPLLTGVKEKPSELFVKFLDPEPIPHKAAWGRIRRQRVEITIDPLALTKDFNSAIKFSTNSSQVSEIALQTYGALPPTVR